MKNLYELPKNLPVPTDDGACDHLSGAAMPSITLSSTSGRLVDLEKATRPPCVLFFYPRTGDPQSPTSADWDRIPGARGCTPQNCGFRDHHSEFRRLGISVYGISSQTTEYQREFVERNKIPYELLSDSGFALTKALKLPTFDYNGLRLIRRLALFLENSTIQKVFYPVFPPDKNAEQVLEWAARGR